MASDSGPKERYDKQFTDIVGRDVFWHAWTSLLGKSEFERIDQAVQLEQAKRARRQISHDLSDPDKAQPFTRREKIYLGIVVGTLAVAAVMVGKFMVNGEESPDQHAAIVSAAISNATAPQFRDPTQLRLSGACGDELRAEQAITAAFARNTDYASTPADFQAIAARYGAAADLADQNNIPCSPMSDTAPDLTPDASVTKLMQSHRCAKVLLEDIGVLNAQPSIGPDYSYNMLQIAAYSIDADLAAKYAVRC